MLKYKIDVIEALKSKGYTTYTMRKENLLAQGTLTRIRKGIVVNAENLNTLCELLECQPGDLIEFVSARTKDQPNDQVQN